MTTYRERRENKITKLEEWAQKREQKSDAAFNRFHSIADNIPLGQPILVGHHSEKHHRADIARMDNALHAGVENHNKAQEMTSRADGIRSQLDRSIYDDDPDAIEQLQARIDANIKKRDAMKNVNTLWRKKDAAGLAALGIDIVKLNEKLATMGAWFGKQPYMPYELTNLGACIRKDQERVKIIQTKKNRHEKAEAAGVLVEKGEFGYCRVTFPDKPDYEIIDALKSANFHWSRGSWTGETAKIPAIIYTMDKETQNNIDAMTEFNPCVALLAV